MLNERIGNGCCQYYSIQFIKITMAQEKFFRDHHHQSMDN